MFSAWRAVLLLAAGAVIANADIPFYDINKPEYAEYRKDFKDFDSNGKNICQKAVGSSSWPQRSRFLLCLEHCVS